MTTNDADYFIARYRLRLKSNIVQNNPNMTDMPKGSTHYKCQLRNRYERRFSFYFSHGPAIYETPSLKNVLETFMLDASYDEPDFETHYRELIASDRDGIAAKLKHNYLALQSQMRRLKIFLGDDAWNELQQLHF